jgi:ABC-2 type transport system permease protein
MNNYWNIFIKKNLMQLQSDLAYRTEVLFMLLSTTVTLSTTVIMYFLLFSQVKSVGDWRYTDLLYLLSTGNIAISIYTIFSWGSIYHQFRPAVKTGSLDYYLLKPKSPYFLLSSGRFDFSGLARLVPSIGLLIYLLFNKPLSTSPFYFVLFFIVTLIGIVLLHTTIFLFYTLSFWTTSTDYFHHFAWAVVGAASMPMTVFPEAVYWVFSTIFPVAYAAVVPTRLVLGLEPLAPMLLAKLIIIPLAYLLISSWVWKKGLKHYSGASA